MDRVAIATVKQWRFTPASKNGMPVDAIVEIEMSFTFR
jgi:outer membrane biosynthesis protein TonB